jgi:hypothetical protein
MGKQDYAVPEQQSQPYGQSLMERTKKLRSQWFAAAKQQTTEKEEKWKS